MLYKKIYIIIIKQRNPTYLNQQRANSKENTSKMSPVMDWVVGSLSGPAWMFWRFWRSGHTQAHQCSAAPWRPAGSQLVAVVSSLTRSRPRLVIFGTTLVDLASCEENLGPRGRGSSGWLGLVPFLRMAVLFFFQDFFFFPLLRRVLLCLTSPCGIKLEKKNGLTVQFCKVRSQISVSRLSNANTLFTNCYCSLMCFIVWF